MTIRNLDGLFTPKSIALIGASKTENSVGAVISRNLFRTGFDGPIMPVNPHHQAIEGVLTYPDVASLPLAPELAVIATPPDTVPALIQQLGERGTKAAVIISAGFSEGGDEHGEGLVQSVLDAARPHLLRVVGPNCVGVMLPDLGINASFSHIAPDAGNLAFIAQSGAILTTVLDWSSSRDIGFSCMVSLGDMIDVDFGDLLDYLANDPNTKAILLYVEAVTNARKFMSAARAAARMKPVIVVKAGRHAESAKAARSHTGALAGADDANDAIFRRAGMLRVYALDQLFEAVEALALMRPPKGDRLAIISNGGGLGVMATDALIEEGGKLAEISPATIERLSKTLPATWSKGNPIDIIGDAPPARYTHAMEAVMADKNVDAILAINCPTAVASGTDAAQAVVDTLRGVKSYPTFFTSWVGEDATVEARRMFRRHSVPTYDTPEQAVRAFMYLVNYRRNQEMLMETPPSVPEDFRPDVTTARRLIETALADDVSWLAEPAAKELLAAYGIPVVATKIARSPEEAAKIASELGVPIALKILSPDILHKSNLGGVALDLVDSATVRAAADDMLMRIKNAQPAAHIEGFTVQPMVRRRKAFELIIGVVEDPQFGPVILFGQGGTAVEVVDDKALGIPPLNMHLARDLISRTRISRLLAGYRDVPAADLEAIALTLIQVAQMVIDHPEITELDINPLLADEHGVIALDARVKIVATTNASTKRLTIRPYPTELEQDLTLDDGRKFLLRPIRPEDEPRLQDAFSKLTPEEIHLRFHASMKSLSHVTAARFTQLDYDREMALILTVPGVPGTTDIFGVVRISADPDNRRAEFAIIVLRELTGRGLGKFMMEQIIAYARSRGTGELNGDVLFNNVVMLNLCKSLGFIRGDDGGSSDVIRIHLDLASEPRNAD